MFAPKEFAIEDEAVLRDMIAANPLATLVLNGLHGPISAYAPVVFDPNDDGASILLCHIARVNPFWSSADQAQVLAIFAGADGYISPSYYPSKAEDGRVVPTWNYVRVEARGRCEIETDPSHLRPYVEAMTETMEAKRPDAWKVSDAPQKYTEALLKGIIGIKIHITSLHGSYKLSQNKTQQDRQGVLTGLVQDEVEPLAEAMEKYVSE